MRLLQLFNTMQLSKNSPPKWEIFSSSVLIDGGRDRNRTCDLILIRDAL